MCFQCENNLPVEHQEVVTVSQQSDNLVSVENIVLQSEQTPWDQWERYTEIHIEAHDNARTSDDQASSWHSQILYHHVWYDIARQIPHLHPKRNYGKIVAPSSSRFR